MEKLMGQDEDREIMYHELSWAKQTPLGKSSLIYCQLKLSWTVRNKDKNIKNHLTLIHTQPQFSQGQLHSFTPNSSPHQAAQGRMDGGRRLQ